jgi:molecular chaperone GrpE
MTICRKLKYGNIIDIFKSTKKKSMSQNVDIENEEIPDISSVPQEENDNDQTQNEEISSSIEKLENENQELKDKYLRLFAEFDNYKKRTVKERLELMRTAAQETILAILPVLDDFDRAKKLADEPGSTEVFSEGANIVYHKLYAVLKNRGLEPMDTHHQPFDPEFHEALTEIPAPTDELKGKIVDTIEKGYKLGDKIIRYAKVVVGN